MCLNLYPLTWQKVAWYHAGLLMLRHLGNKYWSQGQTNINAQKIALLCMCLRFQKLTVTVYFSDNLRVVGKSPVCMEKQICATLGRSAKSNQVKSVQHTDTPCRPHIRHTDPAVSLREFPCWPSLNLSVDLLLYSLWYSFLYHGHVINGRLTLSC